MVRICVGVGAVLALGLAMTAPVMAQEGGRVTAEDLLRQLDPGEKGLEYRGIPEPGYRGLAVSPGRTEQPAATAAAEDAGPSVALQIQFEFDSDRLTADARAQLDELASAISSSRLAGYRFLLEGHSDASGDAAYNRALSERRARSARGYLTGTHGIAPERIAARGLGEDYPADPQNPEAAINRRVVITNLGR